MSHRLAILSVVSLILTAVGPGNSAEWRKVFERVRQSEDELWLERIAADETTAEELLTGTRFQPKKLRQLAFVSLGTLHTKEAADAIRRIEAAARPVAPAPTQVTLGPWPHPAEHVSDSIVKPIAQTTTADGTTYAIVLSDLLGRLDAFLISRTDSDPPGSWNRPKLIPRRIAFAVRESELTWMEPNQLVFQFSEDRPELSRSRTHGALGPAGALGLDSQEWILSVDEIEADSDNDGWTDIEEARLSLDPYDPDTDQDGLRDGEDPCPNYAPRLGESEEPEVQILQKALFAMFGLTRSRSLLLVESVFPRLQIWGYPGPIIYAGDREKWLSEHGFGAVFVSWKIIYKAGTEALIEIIDYEGPRSAGGYAVHLEKMDDEWFVTKIEMKWIS